MPICAGGVDVAAPRRIVGGGEMGFFERGWEESERVEIDGFFLGGGGFILFYKLAKPPQGRGLSFFFFFFRRLLFGAEKIRYFARGNGDRERLRRQIFSLVDFSGFVFLFFFLRNRNRKIFLAGLLIPDYCFGFPEKVEGGGAKNGKE